MAQQDDKIRVPIEKQPGVKVVQTNCFECHSKCGILAYVKDGRLVKVKGNPNDPRSRGVMCSKGQAAIQILYSPQRVNYCLRRTRPKGDPDPGWERISHREAMDIIYDRIIKYREEFGAKSVAVGQGTGRGVNQWTMRLGNTIGQNHLISPGHICMGPMLTSSLISLNGFPFLDGTDVENSNCYVVWGANPLWTEAGITAHRFQKFMQKGGKLIVVDPLFLNPLAHKADLWLPIRPGSDGAMVMAWINVILAEKLYDEDFLVNWTNACHLVEMKNGYCLTEADIDSGGDSGSFMVWDKLSNAPRCAGEPGVEPALLGSYEANGIPVKTALQMLFEEAAEFTPERAADITWVEANKIRAAAVTYAKNSPGSSIETMQGVEEVPGCVHTLRGLLILMMLTGNLDAKGGNVFYPFWRDMVDPRLIGAPSWENEANKLAPYPLALYPASQPKAFWDAILTGEPYPVKMLLQIAGNPLAYNENTARVREALEELEFLVVRDYFISATAKLADIVMPAAHWTERDYIADEECARWCYAQQKAVEPLYDRTSDITFIRELGRRIDPETWPWETDEELFDYQLEPLGISWEELKEKYCHELVPESYQKYASGDPAWQIMTPSGKFELFSNMLKTFGLDPLPKYTENPETPLSNPEMAGEYPLVLTTGTRVPYFYHSTFHNIPWLRSMQADPQCFVNTRTAWQAGIGENDWVWIETPHGRARARAHLTEGIHPRVVSAQHGWGMGCPELGMKDFNDDVNINNCVSDTQFGRETYTPPMRGLLCRVYPADKK
jgi:anaerobic selenocysteine-containing dehydrogenase